MASSRARHFSLMHRSSKRNHPIIAPTTSPLFRSLSEFRCANKSSMIIRERSQAYYRLRKARFPRELFSGRLGGNPARRELTLYASLIRTVSADDYACSCCFEQVVDVSPYPLTY